jgi:hypothetical protein
MSQEKNTQLYIQWWWWVIIDHALAYLQVTFPSYKLNHVVVELLICWLEHQRVGV